MCENLEGFRRGNPPRAHPAKFESPQATFADNVYTLLSCRQRSRKLRYEETPAEHLKPKAEVE